MRISGCAFPNARPAARAGIGLQTRLGANTRAGCRAVPESGWVARSTLATLLAIVPRCGSLSSFPWLLPALPPPCCGGVLPCDRGNSSSTIINCPPACCSGCARLIRRWTTSSWRWWRRGCGSFSVVRWLPTSRRWRCRRRWWMSCGTTSFSIPATISSSASVRLATTCTTRRRW